MLGLWGAFAYLATLVPRDLALEVTRRLNMLRVTAIVLAILTTILAMPLETAMIGDGWNDALDPAALRVVLLESSVGHAWQIQAAAAVLLAATLGMPARAQLGGTAGAAGLALIALTFTGHAVMHEGWLGLAHRTNDGLHLLSAGAWFGALFPLVPVLRALDDPARRGQAVLALRRFSTAGHIAVVLVLSTGALNTALVLGRVPVDLSSPYQAMLAAKIAAVVGMTGLAVLNRYVFVPRMTKRPRENVAAIRHATLFEIALGIVALALVAVFGLIEPA